MSKEKKRGVLQESSRILLPMALLAVSFFSVSFLDSRKGFTVKSETNLDSLSEPELRVAKKLLELGITPSFEGIEVRLDDPIEVAGRDRRTGKSRMKSITTPDFNFTIDGVECFLEIGSRSINSHKRRQARVMEKMMELRKNKPRIYLQMFNEDIALFEESVETQEDLLSYLYEHERTLFTG